METTVTYDIIWGSAERPMVSKNLCRDCAQALIDDLEARNFTYTVVETSDVPA